MKNPVIFLDIDGVLNNVSCMGEDIHILPEKVKLLDQIQRATKADIVISSSWRKLHPLETIREILWCAGLVNAHHCVIGVTPSLYEIGTIRGNEIDAWMDENLFDPTETSYLILDDDSDFDEDQRTRHLHTSNECGLRHRDVQDAINCLTGPLRFR